MLEQRTIKKVIVKKKYGNGVEKKALTYNELLVIKKWILTGSFNNVFESDLNKIESGKIHLIKKASFTEPQQLCKAMLDYSKIAIKKDTLFITLIIMSSGNFQSKKLFKDSFNKIIKTPNDLYKFLSLTRRYRGFGSIIHNAIKKWFKSNSITALERMFVEERSKYNWSGQDIVRMIKPKPRDRKENLLFKWLAKDEIDKNDLLDYQSILPMIYHYEQMRNNNFDNIISSIKKYDFTRKMIPANAFTDEVFNYYKNEMSDEQIVLSLKDDFVNQTFISNRLDKIIEKKSLKLDILDLVSVQDSMFKNNCSSLLINKIEQIITYKLKKYIKSNGEVLHIIDMNNHMFNIKNKFFKATNAVVASIFSSNTDEVYSFSGDRIIRDTKRSILEAEGPQIPFGKITKLNIDGIKENSSFMPKIIFIWTNKDYLKELEREISILKIIYSKTKICLINLENSRLNNKNPKYYVLNGFNQNTKKLMKLMYKGIID